MGNMKDLWKGGTVCLLVLPGFPVPPCSALGHHGAPLWGSREVGALRHRAVRVGPGAHRGCLRGEG